ncbi:hypothetical protein [Dokdonia sinensis]|nr:hypothetical protein [Dokdonia sinensis]
MQSKQSTKQPSKYQVRNKRKVLTAGTIIAVAILIVPYLWTLYQGFPNERSWETFFGIYDSGYYESVYVAAWTLWGKLIPLYLLFIWFFTCRHWWYHVILVPICMYIKQIFDILNDDLRFADNNDIFYLAPIILLMAIFVYTIRTKIFDKIHGIDLSELGRVSLKGNVQLETEEDEFSDGEDEDEEDVFMG